MSDEDRQAHGRSIGRLLLTIASDVARGIGKLLLAVVCVLLIVGALLMLESAPRWVLAAVAIGVLLVSLAILRTVHRRVEVKPERRGSAGPRDDSGDGPRAD